MKTIITVALTSFLLGCVWHPRTPGSKAPSWARAADTTDLICTYERPVGSNRKIRSCRSPQQVALEQETGEAFLRKHQEPRSLLKEQRPRGQ